jgi:hypothetical protein
MHRLAVKAKLGREAASETSESAEMKLIKKGMYAHKCWHSNIS